MNDNRNPKQDPRRRSIPPHPMTEREAIRRSTTRPRRRKPTATGILAVIVILALVAVLAVCGYNIATGRHLPDEHRSELADSLMATGSSETQLSTPNVNPFTEERVSDDEMHKGSLILVNFAHEYVFPKDESSLVSIYENKNDYYKVAYTDYKLDETTLRCFNRLVSELGRTTGDRTLLVNSSYRSYEDQVDVYQSFTESNGADYAQRYVAQPGQSEHHTGLALDLTTMRDDGTYVVMENYEYLPQFNALAVQRGFTQRYPENKYDYTHINTEPWHYRYVGVPHAYIMWRLGLCLEEYTDYLRTYTADGRILTVADGTGELGECSSATLPETGYAVYFCPASGKGETVLPIPTSASSHEVSGNNVDGFIVTAVFGEPTLPEATSAATAHSARQSQNTGA